MPLALVTARTLVTRVALAGLHGEAARMIRKCVPYVPWGSTVLPRRWPLGSYHASLLYERARQAHVMVALCRFL